jgi:gluconate 2-dehydrogenase gamma chain
MKKQAGMKRREFLTIPAAALGGTLLYTLAREPFRLQAQAGVVKVPLRFFTATEASVIAAACERIFPSDATGPGAKEAGVVIYIDRQLAGPYGADKYRYTKGPFVESVPEHGYQAKENPRET